MRTRTGLRVVLDGKDRMIQTGHPLNRVVVQADMGEREFSMTRVDHGRVLRHVKKGRRTLHGEIMVLRGDFNFSRPKIHHGMIRPMVTELQLIGLEAKAKQRI